MVNPVQARALLDAVAAQEPSGDRLVAFFGAMYYAALRPGEASTLRKANLALPAEGWGELLLESSTPEAGASWTDSGRRREERQLKHRARGETRIVPSPPALTALLHAHLESFGTGPDGLLFRGVRGGQLAESTYCRVWRKARVAALTEDEAASPLARRPYDLRHAAVSTWLNAGVPSTQVAAWAGHSVGVLHQITRRSSSARRTRLDVGSTRYSVATDGRNFSTYSAQTAGDHRCPPDTAGQHKIARRVGYCWSDGDSAGCGRVPPVGLEPTLEPF
ncbi:tyrosine-type recombinase/integrase [Pseudonocardia alaniniphila]|uniref:tyrosine-type recombinase/integrase n=1 Tax=Pseudonocardia alaniniphila TaxID=75291 RepID=UPI0030B90697